MIFCEAPKTLNSNNKQNILFHKPTSTQPINRTIQVNERKYFNPLDNTIQRTTIEGQNNAVIQRVCIRLNGDPKQEQLFDSLHYAGINQFPMAFVHEFGTLEDSTSYAKKYLSPTNQKNISHKDMLKEECKRLTLKSNNEDIIFEGHGPGTTTDSLENFTRGLQNLFNTGKCIEDYSAKDLAEIVNTILTNSNMKTSWDGKIILLGCKTDTYVKQAINEISTILGKPISVLATTTDLATDAINEPPQNKLKLMYSKSKDEFKNIDKITCLVNEFKEFTVTCIESEYKEKYAEFNKSTKKHQLWINYLKSKKDNIKPMQNYLTNIKNSDKEGQSILDEINKSLNTTSTKIDNMLNKANQGLDFSSFLDNNQWNHDMDICKVFLTKLRTYTPHIKEFYGYTKQNITSFTPNEFINTPTEAPKTNTFTLDEFLNAPDEQPKTNTFTLDEFLNTPDEQ